MDREVASDRSQQALDRAFVEIHVEEAANDLRSTSRVDLLHVNLDKFDETVLVQVQNKIVYEIEAVADDDDERKLILQLGLLEIVLDLF